MNDLAETLFTSLERKDARLFAATSTRLRNFEGEREAVWQGLLEIFTGGDVHRAEIAIDALRYAGLVLDDECYDELILAAQRRFTSHEVTELARDNCVRLTKGRNTTEFNKSVLSRLRLLRSTILASMRRDDPRGREFVAAIERELSGTQLADCVSEWRRIGDS